MLNVIIWGAGKNCKIVLEAIRKDKCNLIGIADSNKDLHKTLFMNKWQIDAPEALMCNRVDFVVISVRSNREILQKCEKIGIEKSKIIEFWESNEEYEFIDANVKKIFLLEKELKKCGQQLRNMPYELGLKVTPTIRSAEKLLKIIIDEKKSMSRFGDGELELMQGRERPWFQAQDENLTERLKEVFNSKEDQVIIALADNFGNLDRYTEQAADAIREYLDNGIRENLMNVIDINRTYYDTYVTRPYIIYKDKKYAKKIFELFKKIWKGRDVLIIEGTRAFTGVRNDLFKDAASVRRILAPAKNAFLKYEQLLSLAKENVAGDTLVLISLGPTATVLAYDLALEGIQALDIGQLDNEYEWYQRGAFERVEIPGKCVAELPQCHEVSVIEDIEYAKQIVGRVESI